MCTAKAKTLQLRNHGICIIYGQQIYQKKFSINYVNIIYIMSIFVSIFQNIFPGAKIN